MCDTFVILPGSTADNKTYFAKNSDRSPNEPNLIISRPAETHDLSAGPDVALTYVSIPQVTETYGFVMVKPSWTWGCEMGVNQHGVAIGNEAVFTKGTYGENALLGMDVCRLVLERCRTAEEGMHLIGALLEEHGQGGNGGYDTDFRYDNSYLVADPGNAYVVETAGKFWVAKRVESLYAISNALTLERNWEWGSAELTGAKFRVNFSSKYERRLYDTFSGASVRRFAIYTGLLDDREGALQKNLMSSLLGSGYAKREKARGIDYETCRRMLRLHTPGARKLAESPCMHYGDRFGDQTTGSMICVLEDQKIALTGSSSPCKSVFKPFSLLGPLPFGDDPAAAEQYWARRELIQRNLLGGAISESEYLRGAKETEREIELLAKGFTPFNAAGLNRQIYDIENEMVLSCFSRCSREPDALTPKKGTANFKSRWKKKNEAFLKHIAAMDL